MANQRMDLKALDNVANAPLLDPYANTSKKMRGSSLREYRDSGAISRGTIQSMRNADATLAKIQPEIKSYNASLSEAKSYIPDYVAGATSYNSELDSLEKTQDRLNADPGNSGLIKALGNYNYRITTAADKASIAARKISGGDAIKYSQSDVDSGVGRQYDKETRYVDNPILGEDGKPTYTADDAGNLIPRTTRVWNDKDPARPALKLDGANVSAAYAAAKGDVEKSNAAQKHDMKRFQASKGGGLLASVEDAPSASSAFAETGNSAISSLAKYRKG